MTDLEIVTELARQRNVVWLRNEFRFSFRKILNAEPPPETFNAWYLKEISRSSNSDPLLPDCVSLEPPKDLMGTSAFAKYASRSIAVAIPLKKALLDLEISTRKLWKAAVEQLAEDVCWCENNQVGNFQVSMDIAEDGSACVKLIPPENLEISYFTENQSLEYTVIPKYFEKLRKMYSGDEKKFPTFFWLLLHRYTTLLGPRKSEGRGWQLSVPAGFMEQISRSVGCMPCEAFASPFNVQPGNSYFSLFKDTDQFFGSFGNLFSASETFLPEIMEVNPPFEISMMRRVIGYFLKILEMRESESRKFLVFFILPNWRGSAGIEKLNTSPFLQFSEILPRGSHRYENGFQHDLEISSHRLPSWVECDTLIAVLKTSASPSLSLDPSEIAKSWT